jgi:uncharacterized alkaline shock family protein YloU
MTNPPVPALQVSDNAIARIAAYAALTTPGVAWLHPAATRVLTRAAAGFVRTRPPRTPADLAAVTVEQAASPGPVRVTVRIVATGHPPVLATAAAVQQHVRDTLRQLADLDADVRVHVTAFDPQPAAIAETRPDREL